MHYEKHEASHPLAQLSDKKELNGFLWLFTSANRIQECQQHW